MKYFASVNQSNILYIRKGTKKTQYFKNAHGGSTVEMEPLGDYDYRAVFPDGRMTVIPHHKLPSEWEGWVCMPKMYFPSKGDWGHMQTKTDPGLSERGRKVPKKLTLAEMLEEMNA